MGQLSVVDDALHSRIACAQLIGIGTCLQDRSPSGYSLFLSRIDKRGPRRIPFFSFANEKPRRCMQRVGSQKEEPKSSLRMVCGFSSVDNTNLSMRKQYEPLASAQ